jgi:hypothetical protein
MSDRESPTGRGYTQGSDSYNRYDMDKIDREHERAAAVKSGCTCWDSVFGMDIDRCPVHGIGST